jgi:hypothetical protein
VLFPQRWDSLVGKLGTCAIRSTLCLRRRRERRRARARKRGRAIARAALPRGTGRELTLPRAVLELESLRVEKKAGVV